MDLLLILVNLGFLAAYGFADFKYRKYIPAYSFEPLLLGYSIFTVIAILNTIAAIPLLDAFFYIVLGIIDISILNILSSKYETLAHADILVLALSAFIFPEFFILLLFFSVVISKIIQIKYKKEEIEFLPVWFIVNLLFSVCYLVFK